MSCRRSPSAQHRKDLRQDLRGFVRDRAWLVLAVTACAHLDEQRSVLPIREKTQLMHPVHEARYSDPPAVLCDDEIAHVGAPRSSRDYAPPRHQKRCAEVLRLAFFFTAARNAVRGMQNKVTELMAGIHATVLGGLGCVEEDVRDVASPERECVDVAYFLRQREHSNTL